MILLCSRWMLLPVFATPKVWKRCNSKMSLSTSWWTPWMFFWSDSFCVFLEIDDIYRKPLPKDVFDGNSIQQQLFFHLSHRSLQVFQLPPHVAIPSPPLSQHTKKGFFPPIPGKGPIPSLKKLPQLRDPNKINGGAFEDGVLHQPRWGEQKKWFLGSASELWCRKILKNSIARPLSDGENMTHFHFKEFWVRSN